MESIEKTSPKVSCFLAVCCEICLECTWTQLLIKYLCFVSCSNSKVASLYNKIIFILKCLFVNFQTSTCFVVFGDVCYELLCWLAYKVRVFLEGNIGSGGGVGWGGAGLNAIIPQKIHKYHYCKTIAKHHNTSLLTVCVETQCYTETRTVTC